MSCLATFVLMTVVSVACDSGGQRDTTAAVEVDVAAETGTPAGEARIVDDAGAAGDGYVELSTDAGDAEVAALPPMGFNQYNHFGLHVDEVTMREIVDAMVDNGMRDAGYVYVNIDDSWQGERDAAGNLTANVNYPSGIEAFADFVHGKGMKVGIYTSPHVQSCGLRPGSYGHVQQDVDTFASWGIDYIKLDWCNADITTAGATAIATEWRNAIDRNGRPMVLSINAGDAPEVGDWAKDLANLWRTGDDICASWYNKTRPPEPRAEDCFTTGYHNGIYDYLVSHSAADRERVGPGHWADPDMLEVGNAGLSFDEARTHFSLWAMWSAPLIAGNDPRAMTPRSDAARILLAPEVIAVDQDPAGVMARKVSDDDGRQVWTKPLADGQQAILLLNATDRTTAISTTRAALDIADTAVLRDLWAAEDLDPSRDGVIRHSVPAHGVVMLRTGDGPDPTCPTVERGTDHGTVTMSTSVSVAGTYRVSSRLADVGGDSEGYHLDIDGSCPIRVGGTPLQDGWTWVEHRDGDKDRKVDVRLSAGDHEIRLAGSEVGLRIDQLKLTKVD